MSKYVIKQGANCEVGAEKQRGHIPIICYHGTMGELESEIELYGLRALGKYVFVATDKRVARHYAWAWTGARMLKLRENGKPIPPPGGIIVECKIPPSRLVADDYNPDGEPNQFKVVGHIRPWAIERVTFPGLLEKGEQLRAYCFWIGIARAHEN